MPKRDALASLGEETSDVEEEIFILFCLQETSHNLGFIDPKAQTLQLTVGTRDLTIHQSPTLLSSDRREGTTGAVLWKVTPLFAAWLAQPDNWLFRSSIVGADSTILELGCGISGVNATLVAPRVRRYICTDQEYVFKLLRANLQENAPVIDKDVPRSKKGKRDPSNRKHVPSGSIETFAFDWESNIASGLRTLLQSDDKTGQSSIDLVVACDCIYNEALVQPFVNSCRDICKLDDCRSTVCVVAQQLRSHTVFEAWLKAFLENFHVWRLPNSLLPDELSDDAGFVVHIGILRTNESQVA